MTDILQRILARKAEEIAERSATLPLAALASRIEDLPPTRGFAAAIEDKLAAGLDRKSTRLNSSHVEISYAVFCLKKKRNEVRVRTAPAHTTQTTQRLKIQMS